jgi:hypothetical protein
VSGSKPRRHSPGVAGRVAGRVADRGKRDPRGLKILATLRRSREEFTRPVKARG